MCASAHGGVGDCGEGHLGNGLARGADGDAKVKDFTGLDIVDEAVDEDISRGLGFAGAVKEDRRVNLGGGGGSSSGRGGGRRRGFGGTLSGRSRESGVVLLRESQIKNFHGGRGLLTLRMTEVWAMRATPALTFSSTRARNPAR